MPPVGMQVGARTGTFAALATLASLIAIVAWRHAESTALDAPARSAGVARASARTRERDSAPGSHRHAATSTSNPHATRDDRSDAAPPVDDAFAIHVNGAVASATNPSHG